MTLKAFFITALLAASAAAQQNIRTESRLVLVDSVVTNHKGQFVGDLKQKDFKVWEDGKEQVISTFSFQADPASSQADQKHYLVLLFDDSTIGSENQHNVRDIATRFVTENAGPNRLISIDELTDGFRVAQDFTADVDRLKQAVNETKLSAGVPGVTAPTPQARTSYSPRVILTALRDMATGLAKIPGRKTVIFLSGGLAANPDQLTDVIAACNRANVALYPIALGQGGGGLGSSLTSGMDASSGMVAERTQVTRGRGGNTGPASDEPGVRTPAEVLFALASGTGGYVISRTNDPLPGMDRIAQEQNEHYILGYVPTKDPKPGACHALKVKVDRGGTEVRSRPGYCEAKTLDVLSGTPVQRDLEAHLDPGARPSIEAAMQAPFFYISPNTARVDVALDIPGNGIKFMQDKGKFQANLNVIGIAYLPDGGVAARFSDSVKLTLDSRKQLDEFAARPYHYEKQFEVASGKFTFKLVFSTDAASFGRLEMPLIIDEWGPAKFLLSGLALSKSVRAANASGPNRLDDRVPMIVNGMELTPAGSSHIRKADKAFLFGEIYEPSPTVALGVHMVLLDAKSEKVMKDMGVSPLKGEPAAGSPAVPMGLILPVADLAPGSWTAQITALDATGNQSTRTLNFEIDP